MKKILFEYRLPCRIHQGGGPVKNEVFGFEKNGEYAARAKAAWGNTEAYKEFEKKSRGRTGEDERILGARMMEIFAEFANAKHLGPESCEAQALVQKLKDFITEHYYTCTDQILGSLGQMYAGGGEMTANIDKAAGEGAGAFANEAIEAYILKKAEK